MKTFLIQTDHGEIIDEQGFALLESIRFWNFMQPDDSPFNFVLSDLSNSPHCIPVGSLEFIFDYIKKYHSCTPALFQPINIPKILRQPCFLKRDYEILPYSEINIKTSAFIKSATQYKGFTAIVSPKKEIPAEGIYIVSDVVYIESEWRAFIYHRKLVGLENYSGDFTLFPDIDLIQQMIKTYHTKETPPAYTLDVGINSDLGTFLIEMHPFFACGLYGFRYDHLYPFMLSQTFQWLIKKYQ